MGRAGVTGEAGQSRRGLWVPARTQSKVLKAKVSPTMNTEMVRIPNSGGPSTSGGCRHKLAHNFTPP
ncbi:hypothetical protein Pmani_035410 [Petrolisthes manimaculis]|uniref:Uncharacterized protein n=1 Tax=Petrolisthes manimaculis TaxID=1843537 RepID=A0AAE1NLS6_9EUCA|nr:hypothetical protein Pmani_035410 [Petrolisthes manimaculis]